MASCLSIDEFTLNGITLGPFLFTFLTLPADTVSITNQIEVFVGARLLVLTTDYTVNESNRTITLIATQNDGDILSIKRLTKSDARYTDFTNGAVLSEQILDLDSNQLFFLIQENFCESANSLKLLGGCWNGQGFPTCNFAAGTTNNSLVTLGQVTNLIQGIGSVNVGATNHIEYVGDGAVTEFSISSFSLSQLPPTHDLFVTVDDVLQDSSTGYSTAISGPNQVVRFATAPTNLATIQIRSLAGAVVAAAQSNSIPGQNIQDNSLDISKIFDNIDDFNVWDGLTGTVVLVATAANTSPFASSTQFEPAILSPSQMRNFNPAVRVNRLDQMAAPTNGVSWNSNHIFDLTMGPNPGGNTATNKNYVDSEITNRITSLSPDFQEATQYHSVEASVDGLSGSPALPSSGTIAVSWGTHPGPILMRAYPDISTNNDYNEASIIKTNIMHWPQGTGNLGGDEQGANAGENGWQGDYNDPGSYLIQNSGWAGYLINSGVTSANLYLWINASDTQVQWLLGDSLMATVASADELFQLRFMWWRKDV